MEGTSALKAIMMLLTSMHIYDDLPISQTQQFEPNYFHKMLVILFGDVSLLVRKMKMCRVQLGLCCLMENEKSSVKHFKQFQIMTLENLDILDGCIRTLL